MTIEDATDALLNLFPDGPPLGASREVVVVLRSFQSARDTKWRELRRLERERDAALREGSRVKVSNFKRKRADDRATRCGIRAQQIEIELGLRKVSQG